VRRARVIIVLAVGLVCAVLDGSALAAAPALPTTGNLLVLLDHDRAGAAAGESAVHAAIARLGAPPSGFSVPQIGLITVHPPLGAGLTAFARILRALPGVASVEVEHRYAPRSLPNDPALTAPNQDSGVLEWALAREGFYRAWSVSKGNGALVGVIDTGVDGTHPDLASKIAAAVDQQNPADASGTARSDEVGHGTHVASLACADTDNGIGMAGAGYNCRLVVEKSDFSDSSIAAAIVDATDRHVQALNMSFGPSMATAGPAPGSEVRALDYAAAHDVVLVAAAADDAITEQGDPANVLQPLGTGANLNQGIGLDVTAADYTGNRADFAGYGSEISLAAYGALKPGDNSGSLGLGAAPPGIFGAFPANPTDLEGIPDLCGCRTTFQGSDRYAYLQGTSMAAPQVAAAAALMRQLNPYASSSEVIRTLKLTAQRPAGAGWTSNLGWGILDAGAALDAIRRIDRLPPVSELRAPRLAHKPVFRLRWAGHDQQRPGLIASGIARYDVYVSVNRGRARLLANTTRHSLSFRGQPGFRYVFYAIAVDRAGNRERQPTDVTTRVARRAR
jgi:serine protease